MKKKNALFCLVTLLRSERKVLLLSSLEAILSGIYMIVLTYIPVFLLNVMNKTIDYSAVLLVIMSMCVALFGMEIIRTRIQKASLMEWNAVQNRMKGKLATNAMKMEYARIENPACQDDLFVLVKCLDEKLIQNITSDFFSIISGLITSISLITVFMMLEQYIIGLILLFVVVNGIAGSRAQNADSEFMMKVGTINRKVNYTYDLLINHVYGKELRIYQLRDYLVGKYLQLRREFYEKRKKIGRMYAITYGVSGTTSFLQRIVVYVSVIREYYKGQISIGYVPTLILASERISAALTNSLNAGVRIRHKLKFVKMLYIYIHGEGISKEETCNKISVNKEGSCLEFRNVFYKYPGSEEFAIENFSFTFRAGTKYALVGENGAGKTTLVKLMLRLCKPTQGTILFNNIDIWEYDKQDYWKLFAVVFQHINLFSFTVLENLLLNGDTPDQREIDRAMKLSGFSTVVKHLPNGLSTYINRDYEKNGIYLSHGEAQQLAMARAIIRDAPINVFDEPTAALSPLAEEQTYQSVNLGMENKCVLFISHRLASTSFCDEVVYLKRGKLCEHGTHDELISMKGEYSELFQAQVDAFKKGEI